jgi:hypothetical protein
MGSDSVPAPMLCLAVFGAVFFSVSAAVLLVPQHGKPFREANMFSAWLALFGALGFLIASVEIVLLKGSQTWPFLVLIGICIYVLGAVVVICDAHIYLTNPLIFTEPNQSPWDPVNYILIGAGLFVLGAAVIDGGCLWHLLVDMPRLSFLVWELASAMLFTGSAHFLCPLQHGTYMKHVCE